MAIAVGQTAPDFALQNQDKKEVKLSDFAGKKNVVLVWYPLDWSPTCTNEHACFVNDMRSFDQLDAEVLGVSVDSTWSHKAYADKMGIKYSLLADFHPKGAMSEKYGVYLADKGITATVVSMPCVEWFESQPVEYRDSVLPPVVSARVAVEAAVAQSWYKLVGDTGEIVSIEHYGASADDTTLFREFGFTPEAVVAAAERSLDN